MAESMEPLVSAVIPAYNAATFVCDAIASVLSQTYRRMECVVVDDGSTDGTADLIRSRFGPKVIVIVQENAGVSAARNRAASVARGDFLAFLDADDTWLEHKTEKQVALFQKDPSLSYVYSAYWYVNESLDISRLAGIAPKDLAVRNAATLTTPSINLAQTGMVKTSTFRQLGGFDERLSTSADLDLVLRIVDSSNFEGIPEPLAMYRRHGNQMSQDPRVMEHDATALLEKFYTHTSDPDIRHLKRFAYANLYRVLAVMYAQRGQFARAAALLGRALLRAPGHTARYSLRQLRPRS